MKEEKKKSSFWKPTKAGEKIQGAFSHFSVSTFKAKKKNETDRKVVNLHFNDPKAKLIRFGYLLLDLFAPIREKIKPGDKVEIEYLGKKKIKGGRSLQEYNASWKGKLLERSNGELGKPASKEELDEVFNVPI